MQIKIEKELKIMSIYIIPDRENIEKSLRSEERRVGKEC